MTENRKPLPKNLIILAAAAILLAVCAFALGSWFGNRQDSIGEPEAKAIALSHAQVAEEELTGYSFEKDTKKDVSVYDVAFTAGGYDYEYRLSAATGDIIKYEKKPDQDTTLAQPTQGEAVDEEKAREIALAHAGLSEGDISGYTCKPDVEDGVQVYDIHFRAGDLEYEYEIDPSSGSVRKAETELFDAVQLPPDAKDGKPAAGVAAPSGSPVGEDGAKAAALSHAGLTEGDIFGYTCKLDYEDGVQVYEIDFHAGEYEYDYKINAATGAVLKADKEWEPSAAQPAAGAAAPSGSPVGEDGAKAAALSHAGVTEGDIFGYTCKLDDEDGIQVYEIDFHAGEYEYDYKINAATGAVLKADKEWEPSAAQPAAGAAAPSGSPVGEDTAKAAALSHAGLTERDISGYKCKLDYEDGVQVYDVEFKSGGYEYEYKIHAADGIVLKSEKDRD